MKEVKIRIAREQDYSELAKMRFDHAAEDDIVYGENSTQNTDLEAFAQQFTQFLRRDTRFSIFVAEKNGVIAATMSLQIIPKLPAVDGASARNIAYLTNVYTKPQYRNAGIGTKMLAEIKDFAREAGCELIFVFPSQNSVNFYRRNGFFGDDSLLQCLL